jgi:hypothetical protein
MWNCFLGEAEAEEPSIFCLSREACFLQTLFAKGFIKSPL